METYVLETNREQLLAMCKYLIEYNTNFSESDKEDVRKIRKDLENDPTTLLKAQLNLMFVTLKVSRGKKRNSVLLSLKYIAFYINHAPAHYRRRVL